MKEQWSRAVFQKEAAHDTAEANAAALGQVDILNKLLELDIGQMREVFEEDEQ